MSAAFDAQAELAANFVHADRRDRSELTAKEQRLREPDGYFHYVTSTERAALRELDGEVTPPGATPGERVTASEGYALTRARGRVSEMGVRLMSQSELVSALRLRTNVDTSTASGGGLLVESARDVATAPHPVRLPSLVEVVPVDSLRVHRTATTTYTGTGGEAAEGAALPALTALQLPTGSNEDIVLQRFGLVAQVGLGHWLDRGPFSSTVDMLVRRELVRSLENAMLNSDGTGVRFPGILSAAVSIPTVAVAGGKNELAVAEGVETVQAAGFGYTAPIVALAHPTTLRALRTSQLTTTNAFVFLREVCPDVAAWIPSLAVPVGTVVVGCPGEGAVLWVGPDGLDYEASRSDDQNFVAGLVTLRLQAYCAFRVRQPSAWCSVTGVA